MPVLIPKHADDSVRARLKRKNRISKKIRAHVDAGISRPRLSVFRSGKHIYAQVIDDVNQRTLAAASTLDKEARDDVKGMPKKDQAKKVGLLVAARCKAAGVESVVFDRNGYIYHGRVQALADGAREGSTSKPTKRKR